MPLSVAVLDDVTGQPIAGVAIQIRPQPRPDLRRDLAPVEGTTGADGVAHLTAIARAWGTRWTANWEGFQPVELWKTEKVSMSGVSIQATVQGYDQVQWSLVKNPGRSPVTIRLRPSKSTDARSGNHQIDHQGLARSARHSSQTGLGDSRTLTRVICSQCAGPRSPCGIQSGAASGFVGLDPQHDRANRSAVGWHGNPI